MHHDEDNKVRPEVIQYLRKNGHLVFPHRTEGKLVTRGGKTFFQKLSTLHGTVGESDLLVFHTSSPISPVWMELKRPGKRTIDKDQVTFRTLVQSWGHEYVVVNSVEDCKKLGF